MSAVAESPQRALARIPIEDLEKAMLEREQVPCSVTHRFGPGLYIREVRIPAGTFAVGHHQKCEHLNVMLQGRVLMFLEDGTTKELRAPQVFVGTPGRKVGFIIEDMVWQNIYATPERNVDALEATYIEKSQVWQANAAMKRSIEALTKLPDREDYQRVLEQTGFSHETAVAQSGNEADQAPFPEGNWRVRVADSPIHGRGLFLLSPAEAGEVLAPARVAGKRTPAGRFTNHSAKPNAEMKMQPNGDVLLVAAQRIEGCRGGDDGTEITIDYRQALSLAKEQPCLP